MFALNHKNFSCNESRVEELASRSRKIKAFDPTKDSARAKILAIVPNCDPRCGVPRNSMARVLSTIILLSPVHVA